MTKRILICSLLAIGGHWFLSRQIAAGSGSGAATGGGGATLVTPPALRWALHTVKRSRATKP